ncbi:hypothetical protein MTO96_012411 [Rhipicephalus appendiculatus]
MRDVSSSTARNLRKTALQFTLNLLEQRNEDGGRVLVVHDGYSLNLFKASVLADTLLLRAAMNKGVVEKYVPGSYYEQHLHQDAEKQASLLLKPLEDGHYHVYGVLNYTHQIEPLISQERSLSGGNGAQDIKKVDAEEADGNDLPQIEERALPPPFTIEIFAVSDSKHTSHFGGDEEKFIEYMVVFWNAVSLRFQQLNPPWFHISYRHRNSTEQPYVSLRGPDNLVSNETLLNFERWLWRRRHIRIADVVFLVTARDVVQLVPGGIHTGPAGVAYIGQACMTKKGAIAEDNPSPIFWSQCSRSRTGTSVRLRP